MSLKLPKTYKLILAICVVAGPFIWLVLTEDGKRRSDLFLLHLFGHQPFNLAVENLRPDLAEEPLLGQFTRVEFACSDGRGALGDRRCAAQIGSFNGIPARAVEMVWNDAQLKAVRLDYRRRWHQALIEDLTMRYGRPRQDAVGDRTVLAWRFDGGMLLLPKTLGEGEEAVLMWIGQQG
jgi:hypothetical protein